VENHPHELWQKQKFGVYHTSNGRRLPVHNGALILPEHEQNARADAIGAENYELGGHTFRPVGHLIEGARQYNRNVGLDDPHEHGYDHVRQTAHNLKTIGRAYDKLPNWDDKALPAFGHMRDEINHQYDHLTGRMGIKVHTVDHDPYKNVHEMIHDINHNKTLKVLNTESTGGHPFFTNDENDRFRAVHDAFGHAATGRGFDAHGEEAAFAAHSRMFSPHAKPAMVSETRGQNAFLHLNGEFGDQKIAVLPQHMHELAHDLGQYRHTGSLNGFWNAGKFYPYPQINTYCPQPFVTYSNNTHMAKVDWNEYRTYQDAQRRRYERSGVGGGQEEYDQYFGKGEHRGNGTERLITPKEWMQHSRQQTFDDLSPHEQEWHHGYELGERHGQDAANADFSEMDRAHARSPHPDHFYNGYVEGLNQPQRIAVRIGWVGPGTVRAARWVAQSAPSIIRLAHDSGDAEVVFHCPFCGSGQVLARNDGTIECQFCQACFTVQVQPQYPAFPQTINGMPVQVPGMGPQWPGEEEPAPGAPDPNGMPVPSDTDQDADGIPDEEEAPEGDEDESNEDAPPFAKKSLLYRTDNGDWLDEGQYMRHLALKYSGDRQAVLEQIRKENAMQGRDN